MKRVTIKAEVEDLDLRKLTEALSRAFPGVAVKIETSVEDVQDWKIVEEDDLSPGNGYETREKAEKVRRRLRNGEVRGRLA